MRARCRSGGVLGRSIKSREEVNASRNNFSRNKSKKRSRYCDEIVPFVFVCLRETRNRLSSSLIEERDPFISVSTVVPDARKYSTTWGVSKYVF